MKNIGILFYLVETDIGGKGKGLLLVESCYAHNIVLAIGYSGCPRDIRPTA
jgi:hypothetical protein